MSTLLLLAVAGKIRSLVRSLGSCSLRAFPHLGAGLYRFLSFIFAAADDHCCVALPSPQFHMSPDLGDPAPRPGVRFIFFIAGISQGWDWPLVNRR